MNKEQEELVGEVYDKYTNKYVGYDDVPSKELFLFEIKTNTEFSEKWGLTIEERELSLEERYDLLSDTEKRSFIVAINPGVEYGEEVKYTLDTFYKHVPTKIITITYNDKTIESYEPIR